MKRVKRKLTKEKEEKIKIYLTIFLVIFASIFAFITAYQSTKVVMTNIQISNLYAEAQIMKTGEKINFTDTNDYFIEGQDFIVNINNVDKEDMYSCKIQVNDKDVKEIIFNNANQNINLKEFINEEGYNKINVAIYDSNGEIIASKSVEVSYIKKYKKQFAEKLSKRGISTHFSFRTFNADKMELIDALGANYIRDDMMIEAIDKGEEKYDFWNYNDWMTLANNNEIQVYSILRANSSTPFLGENGKVTNDDEVLRYVNFAKAVANKYPQIKNFEILNEPNAFYVSEEDAYWYTRLLERTSKELKKLNNDYKIWGRSYYDH